MTAATTLAGQEWPEYLCLTPLISILHHLAGGGGSD